MSGLENIPCCPCMAMHLMESSHDLLSSGYAYDSVPPGQAMMEHDNLAGCPNCGIMYMMGDSELVGYTDADWANDRSNCCSISGYAFLYSGGAVSWMSRQQSTITTSSTHTEYIAAAEATKELVWLCCLLTEL